MRISEITLLEKQTEQKFMSWTIRVIPGKGGIAFKSKDEYIKSTETDPAKALMDLQKQIRDQHSETSQGSKPNIQSKDVTKTTGVFNVATTRDIFDQGIPPLAKISDEGGPVHIDFLKPNSDVELYKSDGFVQITNRKFGKGDEVFKMNITPNQVTKLGLEFAGIYGMDETQSSDPDLRRFTLTPHPVDYLEGIEHRKVFPFPTFSIPTWTVGQKAEVDEDRRSDLDYDDSGDRVVVKLKGRESETQTKINKIDARLAEKAKALARERQEATKAQKERFKELFDAADEAKTLVIETVSFSQTLSKKSQTEKTKINYEKVLEELRKLKPELNAQLDALLEEFSEIKQTEVPQKLLPPQPLPLKENVLKAIVRRVMTFVARFKKWATGYRNKLDQIKEMVPSSLNEESVLSSWIEDLAYSPAADNDQEGDVEMTLGNGRVYTVHSVPYGEFQDWLASGSKGGFWHSNIRGTYMVT